MDPFAELHTEVSSAADFFPTVKVVLHSRVSYMRCNGDPARNSQNTHKMVAFIGKSDITKPISDYGKMVNRYIGRSLVCNSYVE
ncbi:hypothetical protein DPX16_22237 [Anabarilius grahami]|uniref:Uncharacterized protein n=1 Tax=Anabarilius grahami TaxID=495550 RepID=A0A3N0XNR1_ANAGA|nr:hypothetical protein DPX16_22237 [Anabarilius grahami]